MAYIMWKNVGRLVDDHGHYNVKFRLKDVCLGPLAGIILVVTGLATFIVYEVMVKENHKQRENALLIHFIMNVVIVSLMSVSTVAGCAVYKLDHRDHISEKNPTRSLDVGLLVGASMGQFIISYFTIVAVVATGAKGYLNALDLAWAVLTVVQLSLQNFFIIEGLRREPFHVMQAAALRTNAHAFQGHTEMTSMDDIPRNFLSMQQGLNWKRRVVKEVCAFLLLANIIVSLIISIHVIFYYTTDFLIDLVSSHFCLIKKFTFQAGFHCPDHRLFVLTALDHACIWCSSAV